MYALEVLVSMNARVSAPAEDAYSRHCSYHETKQGIVLHSAILRSTAMITKPAERKVFLASWFGTNSAVKRDALVESYFNN